MVEDMIADDFPVEELPPFGTLDGTPGYVFVRWSILFWLSAAGLPGLGGFLASAYVGNRVLRHDG